MMYAGRFLPVIRSADDVKQLISGFAGKFWSLTDAIWITLLGELRRWCFWSQC